jgi:omega-amidase
VWNVLLRAQLPNVEKTIHHILNVEDKATNLSTCRRYITIAAEAGAQLIVLPEIWNSPYAAAAFPEYAESLNYDSPSTNLLMKQAIQHQVWIVGGSIPEIDKDNDNKIYNTCPILNPKGEIVAKHRKAHLFDVNVPNGIRFFESETLSAGSAVTSFMSPWGRIGIGICYDIRFPEYALALRQLGCNILIYPGAFNLTTGPAHWELLQRARAVDTQCFVLTASPARSPTDAGTCAADKSSSSSSSPSSGKRKYPPYSAWGHSTAVSPWGEILATRDETEGIVLADLDLQKVDEMRQAIPTGQQKRTDLYHLSLFSTTDRSSR